MDFRKFWTIMLGLGIMAGSARATISYQSSQTSFANQATVTDGLTLSSLITFTAADLTTLAGSGVANDEYIDPTTGVEFLAFNSNGSSNVAFASVTAGTLYTAANLGDSIEVIFPSGMDYGFAFNFTTTRSFGTFCVDTSPATFGNCASGGTTITSGNSGFIGALNDYQAPPAALAAVWIHPQSGGGADTDIQSFEVATQSQAPTPEGPTMLLIGGGLIALYCLHRRRRPLVLA